MNPIENPMAQLERAIERRPNRPTNEAQLWRTVQEESANINMWDVLRLFFPTHRRYTALVEAAGGHTQYQNDDFLYISIIEIRKLFNIVLMF